MAMFHRVQQRKQLLHVISPAAELSKNSCVIWNKTVISRSWAEKHMQLKDNKHKSLLRAENNFYPQNQLISISLKLKSFHSAHLGFQYREQSDKNERLLKNNIKTDSRRNKLNLSKQSKIKVFW